MFVTVGNFARKCIDLKEEVKTRLNELLDEFGKLLFIDGEGNPIIDLAIGPKDRETDLYPDLDYIDKGGIHCHDACEGEDIKFCFGSPDVSTDDYCSIVDNAELLVEATYDLEVKGTDIKGQSYKALLLLDSIMEYGQWVVKQINYPNGYTRKSAAVLEKE